MMDQSEQPGAVRSSVGPRKRSTFHGYLPQSSQCPQDDDRDENEDRPKMYIWRGYYHFGDHCYPLLLLDEEERLSFLISSGSYFFGALLGFAAAILDLRSAMRHAGDGDDVDDDVYADEWIYQKIFWKWDTLKVLGVLSTSFYLVSSFSDFVCDGYGCRRSCAQWLKTITFSSGAMLDLLSSVLTTDSSSGNESSDIKIIKFLSKESSKLCADLFFGSAFFQIWGRVHLYFPQSTERWTIMSGYVNVVADGFFFFGTLIDVVYANVNLPGGTKNRQWLYESILGLFSALFWLANSVLSVVGDLMLTEVGEESDSDTEDCPSEHKSEHNVVRYTGVGDDLKFYVLL